MAQIEDRIATALVSWRYVLLAIGCALAVVAALTARRLEFDQSIENMFVANDPVLLSYGKLKRTFGGNEIVLAIYEDEQLLNPDRQGVRRLKSIAEQLADVDGVDGTFGLHGPLGEMIVDPNNRLAQRALAMLEGTTHSADGKLAAIACMLDPAPDATARTQTIDSLRDVMEGLHDPLAPGYITGEPVIVSDGFRLIARDGRQLAWGSAILLGLTIAVFFRSIRWMLIPILLVQVVLLYTKSLIATAGIPMTMISSVLTSVAMVITVATLVHFIVRFQTMRGRGLATEQALKETLSVLAAPVFWALLTDAVGFGALMIAKVGPVHDYGVIMSLATLMVLVAVTIMVPGLATLGTRNHDQAPQQIQRPQQPGPLERALNRLSHWVMARPKPVCAAIGLLGIGSAIGLRFLEVETDFTRNFRRGSAIVRGYELVETRLGGAGVCDVILPAPAALDLAYLRRVDELQDELRRSLGEETGLTHAMSLVDGLQLAGVPVIQALPRALQQKALAMALGFLDAQMPAFFGSMFGQDPQTKNHYYRVMLRALERQPAGKKKALIQSIESISKSHFADAEVTGFYVLLSNLIDSVLRDQRRSFVVAIASIAAVMALAFRSWKLALIAMVPNLLPILVVTGVMGWLSVGGFPIKTNLGVALIAAVSLGLSVDSSIHYILAFQRALRDGADTHGAIERVNGTVARALVVSTFALMIGFAVLCRSEFIPTVYFGAIVSLAMLGGLLGNLIALPALLVLLKQD
jgi:predicted RND superfamily exporter protein